jgi:hypothetical protein
VVTVPVPKGAAIFFNNLIPHCSLENHSEHIRWSFDLRWQDPTAPSGFEGKEPILMKTTADPSHVPDWATWAAQNPFALRRAGVGNEASEAVAEEVGKDHSYDAEYDTTITGTREVKAAPCCVRNAF